MVTMLEGKLLVNIKKESCGCIPSRNNLRKDRIRSERCVCLVLVWLLRGWI